MVVLENAPHEGPAGLSRCGPGAAAVRVVASALGAAQRPAGSGEAALKLALLESLADAVAFEARGGDPEGLARLIEEAART